MAPRGDASCKPAPRSKKKSSREQARTRDKDAQKKQEAESVAPPAAPATTDDSRAVQRGERVEFDARLIQGQTAKAGAVYLFARVSTNLRSMVREQSSFRDKIVRTVFSDDASARSPSAKEEDEP